MRAHRAPRVRGIKIFGWGKTKAEDGETRDEGCAPREMFRFGIEPGRKISARLFFVAHCPRPARRPRVRFSNLCHFLDARLHAAAGMANFNGGESVANYSASGMSPLDSSATVRCPQVCR
jgi:hypothetical protein